MSWLMGHQDRIASRARLIPKTNASAKTGTCFHRRLCPYGFLYGILCGLLLSSMATSSFAAELYLEGCSTYPRYDIPLAPSLPISLMTPGHIIGYECHPA